LGAYETEVLVNVVHGVSKQFKELACLMIYRLMCSLHLRNDRTYLTNNGKRFNRVCEQDDSVKICASVQTPNGQIHGEGKILACSWM
jgi:hypothetical protein